MSNDPLVIAREIATYLSDLETKGIFLPMAEQTAKAWRLVKLLEERDGVWRWSAPMTFERVAPEPRMKSVTVTVNFEE